MPHPIPLSVLPERAAQKDFGENTILAELRMPVWGIVGQRAVGGHSHSIFNDD